MALEPDPLFKHIADSAALQAGWRRVRRNGGGPGGDGQTVADFGHRLETNLKRLASELANGTYRPGAPRVWTIEKADGRRRVLSVPPVRDRVVQSTAVVAINPLLEARMSAASFAWRKGLSVEHAISRVTYYRLRGFRWVLDGDIADFFPSLLHAPLMATVRATIPSPACHDLIAAWLRSFSATGRGLAQGSPISPLLANLALSPVDMLIESKIAKLVRYGDDFLLLTRTRDQAETAAERMTALIRPLGLTLHWGKTRIAHFDEGIWFLGYRFERDNLARAARTVVDDRR